MVSTIFVLGEQNIVVKNLVEKTKADSWRTCCYAGCGVGTRRPYSELVAGADCTDETAADKDGEQAGKERR